MRLPVSLVFPLFLVLGAAPAVAQRPTCPPAPQLYSKLDTLRADSVKQRAILAGKKRNFADVPPPRVFCGLKLPAAAQSEQPMILEVVDDNNRAIEGARVTFAPDAGCGSAVVDTAVTDAFGRVRLSWKVGTRAGVCSAVTTVVGSKRFPRVVTTIVTNGPARSIELVRGGNQRAPYGALLPDFIEVEVRDAHGNLARNAVLRFAVKSGGGRIVDYAAVPALNRNTNLVGRARVVWRLGPAGRQELEVRALNVKGAKPLVITATPTG